MEDKTNGHVACTVEIRNAYKIRDRGHHFGNHRIHWEEQRI